MSQKQVHTWSHRTSSGAFLRSGLSARRTTLGMVPFIFLKLNVCRLLLPEFTFWLHDRWIHGSFYPKQIFGFSVMRLFPK